MAGLACGLCLFAGPTLAREKGADGNFTKRDSSHFILYQDVAIDDAAGLRGYRRFEQEVLKVLERAYDQMDALLGLRPPRKLEVVVYDPGVFDRNYNGYFRFAAAGFYHGVIRIRGDTRVTTRLVRVLGHELVHAGLDAAAPSLVLPAWLNEGLAEWFEARSQGKRGLSRNEHAYLQHAHKKGGLFTLAALGRPSFGHLGPDAARLAYLQSYAFIGYLSRAHGEDSIRELTRSLIRSRNLERAIRHTYRTDLGRLQRRFAQDLN